MWETYLRPKTGSSHLIVSKLKKIIFLQYDASIQSPVWTLEKKRGNSKCKSGGPFRTFQAALDFS